MRSVLALGVLRMSSRGELRQIDGQNATVGWRRAVALSVGEERIASDWISYALDQGRPAWYLLRLRRTGWCERDEGLNAYCSS